MKTIELNPTDIEYSSFDINDLETIKEMSFSGHYKSFHENFYYDTFDVVNNDLYMAFELVEIY